MIKWLKTLNLCFISVNYNEILLRNFKSTLFILYIAIGFLVLVPITEIIRAVRKIYSNK
jgi:predicted membrane channel-forming protein YqfA (hemolysin III family)